MYVSLFSCYSAYEIFFKNYCGYHVCHETSGSTIYQVKCSLLQVRLATLGYVPLISSLTCFYCIIIQALVIFSSEGLYMLCVFLPGSWSYSLSWQGEPYYTHPRRGSEEGCGCPWLQLSCWSRKRLSFEAGQIHV